MRKEFRNPSSCYRGRPFWSWNASLDEAELRRQIRIFTQMGLGGFFIHSRIGLATEYLSDEWFRLVRACIDEAKQAKLEAWLYDEDRWSSGAAGGLVTKDERCRMRALHLSRHRPETFDWPDSSDCYVFGATFDDDKITWYKKLDQREDITILPQYAEILKFEVRADQPNPWYNNFTYLDTLDRDAVAKFIDVTHEAYRREVGEEFGKAVPGIFTDEPNHGEVLRGSTAVPWTQNLPDVCRKMFDGDLSQFLPELFFDLATSSFSTIRYQYHVCKTRMFVEAFGKQIGEWCEQNNLMLTGHVLHEEPLARQAGTVGSAMQFLRHMQAPGIGILSQYTREYINVKQCASVAHQTGRKWILSELYGGTGWDTTFETYKHSGDWQAALGVNLRCPHLSWYSMAGEAKRDYPASIHFQSPWWQQYRHVEDYFSRINAVLTEGEPICDLAVLHPIESYYLLLSNDPQARERIRKLDQDHVDMVSWLVQQHLDFDFVDEHLLVDFAAEANRDDVGPCLRVGKMKYRAILVPPMVTLRKTTFNLLEQFAEAGGTVVFTGEAPRLVDAVPCDQVQAFARNKTVEFSTKAIATALATTRRVGIKAGQNEAADILYQFRRIGDDWVIFLANTNRQTGFDQLSVRLNLDLPRGGQVQLWDPINGEQYKLNSELTYRTASFNIDIPPSGSRLVVITSTPENLPMRSRLAPTGKELVLTPAGGWNFLLDDHNVLVLDRVDCTALTKGHDKFVRSKIEILQLDNELRNYLNIEQRGGNMAQPWSTRNQPLGPTANIKLTYKFSVKTSPTDPLLLAVEQPERWTIKLNGKVIPSAMTTGWWVDPAIKTLPVDPSLLVRGRNTLTFEGQFDRLVDLEIVYLLGRFGVENKGAEGALTKTPARLALGRWDTQGLPFYSGNVIYRTTIDFQVRPEHRYLLKLPKFRATAVEISSNAGEPILIAWPEYQADITPLLKTGKNTLDIKLLGSRRNAFGPLHLDEESPRITGPRQYRYNPDNWRDAFHLVEYGLYEPPVIVECKAD